eukprot:TRINITY_DN3088_c0_g2_i5.p1 TRINITY_DN3088_c0_g2~~TRINITY_DN3088_c0_g2_i5.p1  ORF type:complete len:130 (-),score=65.36 TRINITY_DN3088_c0_g2_i5:20-409(-)
MCIRDRYMGIRNSKMSSKDKESAMEIEKTPKDLEKEKEKEKEKETYLEEDDDDFEEFEEEDYQQGPGEDNKDLKEWKEDWDEEDEDDDFANQLRKELTVSAPKLSLIHISEPTRQAEISYAVFCLKKKN